MSNLSIISPHALMTSCNHCLDYSKCLARAILTSTYVSEMYHIPHYSLMSSYRMTVEQ